MSFLKTELLENRIYQEKIHSALFQNNVKHSNMIVVAATSAGKTINELMCADVYLSEDINAHIIIITQTNALCDQLRKECAKLLSLDDNLIILINGNIRPQKRVELWRKSRLSITTASCLINDITQGRLNLSNVPIVVMDEVHNARKKHAYAQVAEELHAKQIRILGFTASAGGSVEKIHELIDVIQAENIFYLSPNDQDYQSYYKGFSENTIKVEIDDNQKNLLRMLEVIFYYPVESLVNAGFMVRGTYYTQTDINQIISRLRALAHLSKKQEEPIYYKLIRDIYIYVLLRYLEECILTGTYYEALRYLKDLKDKQTKSAQAIWKSFETELIYNQLQLFLSQGILHPKVREFGRRTHAIGRYNKTIVFVNNHETGEYLLRFIRENLKINAATMFGKKFMSTKRQQQVLQQFRDDKFRILIATSVAEAGLHISELDRVSHYHPPLNDIAYIQRTGRTGRTKLGIVDFYLIDHPIEMVRYFASKGGRKRQGKNITQVVDEHHNPSSKRKQQSFDLGEMHISPQKKKEDGKTKKTAYSKHSARTI